MVRVDGRLNRVVPVAAAATAAVGSTAEDDRSREDDELERGKDG